MSTLRARRDRACASLEALREQHRRSRQRLDRAAKRAATSPLALAGAAMAGFVAERGRTRTEAGSTSGPRRLLARGLLLSRTVMAFQRWLG